MIKAKFFFILILILTGVSCETKSKKSNFEISTQPTYSASNQYTIYENSLQNITLNDRPISLNALDSILKELKLKGGAVFYRCTEQVNCPPSHSLVIDLITKYGLKLNILISKREYEYTPAVKNIR